MADEMENQLLNMIKEQQRREEYAVKLNQGRLSAEDKAMEIAGNEFYAKMAQNAEKTAGGTDVEGKLSFLQKCKNVVKEFAQSALERWSAKHEKVSPTPQVSHATKTNIEYFHTR